MIPISSVFAILIYSDFRDSYANLKYVLTSEVTAGQMWFVLIMF